MIILASGSPRRKELLSQIVPSFEIITSDADETPTQKVPELIVEELSKRKAEDVFETVKSKDIFKKDPSIIIAADTLVFFGNDRMGKPKDEKDAFRMIKTLSGNVHDVITGVTLICADGDEVRTSTFHEKTSVSVYELSDEEINAYIATKEPMDKAGAYAIQGIFGKYIKGLNGEYGTVVGLPVARLYHEMKNIGFEGWEK